MEQLITFLFVILSLGAVLAALALPIHFLREAKGVKSEKREPRSKELPNDEHKGREAVVRQLARYAASHEYKVVEPCALTGVHGTTDLDAVLVGWFGILGVKCLGYGGSVYGNPDEETWVQSINGKRRSFVNPMTRAEQSARVIRDVLFQAGIKNTPVETVVVFTNKSAELMLPRSTGHYTDKSFAAYLKTVHFEEDKKVQVEPIAELLRSKSL